jgi:hypothetical protein
LVSGLAALVVEAGAGSLSPEEVEKILLCGAAPNGDDPQAVNVINLPRTLQACLRPSKDRPQEQEQAA